MAPLHDVINYIMTEYGQKMSLLNTEEAALELDLSPRTVRRLCESEQLGALKVADRWVIPDYSLNFYRQQSKEE